MEYYDNIYKVVLVGDTCVGKSNILYRFTVDRFDPEARTTIGVGFGAKIVPFNNKKFKIQVWDTAGQERYRAISSNYYRGARGIMLVYDVTRNETFDHINKWLDDIYEHGPENVIIMLVANKIDLDNTVSINTGRNYAVTNNLLFKTTSALTGENINEAFDELLTGIYNQTTFNDLIFDPNIISFSKPKKISAKNSCCK
jgi:small GTP-binding protein